jgi:hypothetical protein
VAAFSTFAVTLAAIAASTAPIGTPALQLDAVFQLSLPPVAPVMVVTAACVIAADIARTAIAVRNTCEVLRNMTWFSLFVNGLSWLLFLQFEHGVGGDAAGRVVPRLLPK